MTFIVRLTRNARADIEEIGDYIAQHDSPAGARYVRDQIELRIASLEEFPNRGGYVNELLDSGVKDFREISFQPYRIIYQVSGDEVHVLLIADGRRDMQTLFQRRLLQA